MPPRAHPATLTGITGAVIRQGPIPYFLHGVIEYAAAILFIVAPFVFGFSDDGSATATSIVVGVLILVVAAITNGPTSIVDSLPVAVHIVLDYILAALLIAIPFIVGFSDQETPTILFIAAGLVHLLITIGTRFAASGKRVEDAP